MINLLTVAIVASFIVGLINFIALLFSGPLLRMMYLGSVVECVVWGIVFAALKHIIIAVQSRSEVASEVEPPDQTALPAVAPIKALHGDAYDVEIVDYH